MSFDHLADEAVGERLALITDHYQARVDGLESQSFGAPPYKPVPPQAMFLEESEWRGLLAGRLVRYLTPFEQASDAKGPVRSMDGRAGRMFAAERASEGANLFDATIAHLRRLQGQGKRVVVAAFTPGARERLGTLLTEHGFADARKVES